MLKNVTEFMIRKKPGKSPKLRAYAAEARALVPFAVELANSLLSDDVPEQAAAKKAALHLNECYKCLSNSSFNPEALRKESIEFCQTYGALEQFFAADGQKVWRVKPKFHIWQECCSLKSNPSLNWVYRDEDFGGYVASMSKLRGGPKLIKNTSENLLHKFRGKHSIQLR